MLTLFLGSLSIRTISRGRSLAALSAWIISVLSEMKPLLLTTRSVG